MSPRRDPYFGRFAFLVGTIGFVVIVLGLVFIWYFFQASGAGGTNPLQELVQQNKQSLPPNQVMLYYTNDGKQLVSTVAEIGSHQGSSPNDKARLIVSKLVSGDDAAYLRSPIPQGTRLNSLFINGKVVTVNLSKEFMTNLQGGVDAELLAVYAIVNSLLFNVENVSAVQILVEGERVLTLGGNIDISQPLVANVGLTRAS